MSGRRAFPELAATARAPLPVNQNMSCEYGGRVRSTLETLALYWINDQSLPTLRRFPVELVPTWFLDAEIFNLVAII